MPGQPLWKYVFCVLLISGCQSPATKLLTRAPLDVPEFSAAQLVASGGLTRPVQSRTSADAARVHDEASGRNEGADVVDATQRQQAARAFAAIESAALAVDERLPFDIQTSTQERQTGPESTDHVVRHQLARPESLFHGEPEPVLMSAIPTSEDSDLINDVVIRAQNGSFYQNPGPGPGRGNAVLEGSPYNNQFQTLPPGWVDINVQAAEGRTGRLMFGAGVNSDAGIVGSFVWDESNFDMFRPPRTFADIIEGRAWRGGGQRFRLEAAPGDIVSRYAASWTDPYFLYSDFSLSLSGFYFNRFYPDWDEDRVGGRVSLGRQITTEWSMAGALRLEEIELKNPTDIDFTTPGVQTAPEIARDLGASFLSTFRASATHDTRDATIMPGQGHYFDMAFEQAFGDFNFPRVESEFRQYFTLHKRPDGSGRQVLTLAGLVGWSGDDTPVFERYYAGGFQSFRGFSYRGVSPRISGPSDSVAVGGNWKLLGTAEYRVPLTANDMIHFVAFTDVGTVETDVSLDNFRATVGVGLRAVVPGMGPVPLAFDFGFPVARGPGDEERIFSFYVGINK